MSRRITRDQFYPHPGARLGYSPAATQPGSPGRPALDECRRWCAACHQGFSTGAWRRHRRGQSCDASGRCHSHLSAFCASSPDPGVALADAVAIAMPLFLPILLPLGAGLLMNARYDEEADMTRPIMAEISNISLAMMLVLNLGNGARSSGVDRNGRDRRDADHHICRPGRGLPVGWTRRGIRKTLAIGSAQRTYAAAFVIAQGSFADRPDASDAVDDIAGKHGRRSGCWGRVRSPCSAEREDRHGTGFLAMICCSGSVWCAPTTLPWGRGERRIMAEPNPEELRKPGELTELGAGSEIDQPGSTRSALPFTTVFGAAFQRAPRCAATP